MLSIPYVGFSQTEYGSEEELIKAADKLFKQKEYYQTMELYSQLLSNHTDDATYLYRYSVSSLFASANKKEALDYLIKASKKEGVSKRIWYFLGQAYHYQYEFDKAIANYKKFESTGSSAEKEGFDAKRQIEMCKNGIRIVNGKRVNISVYDIRDMPKENFYAAYDASLMGGKVLAKLDQFKSPEDKKNGDASPIFLPDNSQVIFYSSQGKGSQGGRDIYMAKKLPGGEWTAGKNLGSVINTPYVEDFPYFHPYKNVMYFSSKGHNSIGGYDIFKAVYNAASDSWSKPVNIGFALNSTYDDLYYVPSLEDEYAFFASERDADYGKVNVFQVKAVSGINDFTIIKGTMVDKNDPQNKTAQIKIYDARTNELIGDFNTNKVTGKYILTLVSGTSYKLVASSYGHKDYKETFYIPESESSEPLEQKIVFNNESTELFNYFDSKAPQEEVVVANTGEESETSTPKNHNALANLTINTVKPTVFKPKEKPKAVKKEYTESELLAAVKKQSAVNQKIQDAINIKVMAANQTANSKKGEFGAKKAEKRELEEKLESASGSEKSYIESKINNVDQEIKQLETESEVASEIQILLANEKARVKSEKEQLDLTLDSYNKAKANNELEDEKGMLQTQLENNKKANANFDNDKIVVNAVESFKSNYEKTNKEKQQLYENATTYANESQALLDEAKLLEEQKDASKGKAIKDELQFQADEVRAEAKEKQELSKQSKLKAQQLEQGLAKADSQLAAARNIGKKIDEITVDAAVNDNLASDSQNTSGDLDSFDENETSGTFNSNEELAFNDSESETDLGFEEETNDFSTESEEDLITKEQVKILREDLAKIKRDAEAEQQPEVKEQLLLKAEALETEITKLENGESTTEEDELTFDDESSAISESNELAIEDELSFEEEADESNSTTTFDSEEAILTDDSSENDVEFNLDEELGIEEESNSSSESEELVINDELDFEEETDDNNTTTFDSEEAILTDENTAGETNNTDSDEDLSFGSDEELTFEDETTAEPELNTESDLNDVFATNDNAETESELGFEEETISDNSSSEEELRLESDLNNNSSDFEESTTTEIDVIAYSNADAKQKATLAKELQQQSNILKAEIATLKTDIETVSDPDLKASMQDRLSTLQSDAKELSDNSSNILAEANSLENSTSGAEEEIAFNDNASSDEEFGFEEETTSDFETNNENSNDSFDFEDSSNNSSTSDTDESFGFEESNNNSSTSNTNEELAFDSSTDEESFDFEETSTETGTTNSSNTSNLQNIDFNTVETVEDIQQYSSNYKTPEAKEEFENSVALMYEADEYKTEAAQLKTDVASITDPEIKEEMEFKISSLEKIANDKKQEAEFSFNRANSLETQNGGGSEPANEFAINDNNESFEGENSSETDSFDSDIDSNNSFGEDESFSFDDENSANNSQTFDDGGFEESDSFDGEDVAIDDLNNTIASAQPAKRSTTSYQAVNLSEDEIEEVKSLPEYQEYEELKEEEEEKADEVNTLQYEVKDTQEQTASLREDVESIEDPDLKAQYLERIETLEGSIATKETKITTAKQELEAKQNQKQEFVANLNPSQKNRILSVAEAGNTDYIEGSGQELASNGGYDFSNQNEGGNNNIFTNEIDLTTTERAFYNDENPIPVNSPLPSGVVFKVQVGAFSKPIPQDLFKGIQPLRGETTDFGVTRYTAGEFSQYGKADAAKEQVRDMGYRDAFVVAFYNGKRISNSEAVALINNGGANSGQNTGGFEEGNQQNADNNTFGGTQNSSNNTGTNFIGNSNTQAGGSTAKSNQTTLDLYTSGNATASETGQSLKSTNGILYTVQVGAYSKPVTSDKLYNLSPLFYDRTSSGVYKYTVGIYGNKADATSAKDRIVALGISDAFVVVYYNGSKIDFQNADKLQDYNRGAVVGDSQPITNEVFENSEAENLPITGDIVFKVQIGAYEYEVPTDVANNFFTVIDKGLEFKKNEQGITIYTVGSFSSVEQARELKDQIVNTFEDAYVVAYANGKKVPLSKAIAASQNR